MYRTMLFAKVVWSSNLKFRKRQDRLKVNIQSLLTCQPFTTNYSKTHIYLTIYWRRQDKTTLRTIVWIFWILFNQKVMSFLC